ncbi:type I-E CRISPR-associated protein Cas6/Cse3/CasE, partial [Lactobacillus salivarius]|nr:type I-E CRISPR-associated protein Cas6/Cse3/CasE [Ligilactobacillus salivarius]
GSKNIKLSRVSFEGLLEITDVDLFRKVLIDGIGKEKAFGMGLMTVIPRR